MTEYHFSSRALALFLVKLLRSNTQRRHTLSWLHSLRKDYLLSTPSPWLTFDAINDLRTRVHPGWRIFEYGSGGSTLFWLQLGAHCVSIEHNPEWYALLQARVAPSAQLDYRLVLPEPISNRSEQTDPSDPKQYLSRSIPNHSFKQYATQIDSFPDESFDMVVVDGRARPSCIMHSVNKVKPGGLLVLDNADREYFLEKTRHLLEGYAEHKLIGATPGVTWHTQTNVYIRQLRRP